MCALVTVPIRGLDPVQAGLPKASRRMTVGVRSTEKGSSWPFEIS
ncbi:hypothetical protein JYK04_01314 [Streptomyces nojiriensis]|nr:hypothetical protein JYK04_01314 [Streptomyces nojiriensis]